jgi:murein DD-endopeptidase MepM/ murein hydrolase activator NlpD
MHLDDILVSKGDEVRQGERVGTVGRTGIVSSGAHLHFELRYDGKHVDPLPALGDLAISPLKTFRGIRLHKEARRLRRLWRRQRK